MSLDIITNHASEIISGRLSSMSLECLEKRCWSLAHIHYQLSGREPEDFKTDYGKLILEKFEKINEHYQYAYILIESSFGGYKTSEEKEEQLIDFIKEFWRKYIVEI